MVVAHPHHVDFALKAKELARKGEAGTPLSRAGLGGQAADPAWWLNLQADSRASVQFRRERRLVRANRAEGAERERLWPWLKGRNPAYVKYERLTSREIPVVVLRTIGE